MSFVARAAHPTTPGTTDLGCLRPVLKHVGLIEPRPRARTRSSVSHIYALSMRPHIVVWGPYKKQTTLIKVIHGVVLMKVHVNCDHLSGEGGASARRAQLPNVIKVRDNVIVADDTRPTRAN